MYNWSDYITENNRGFYQEDRIKVRYDTLIQTILWRQSFGRQVGIRRCRAHRVFSRTQIKAGVFQKLDKQKLPNLANIWPIIAARRKI
jgi:putrescine transport system substrate-binding protein